MPVAIRWREVRRGCFGTVPPEAYGTRETLMTDDDIPRGSSPGLCGVSAHIVASTPVVAKRTPRGAAEWLRHMRPTAIVGHPCYVFEKSDRRTAR